MFSLFIAMVSSISYMDLIFISHSLINGMFLVFQLIGINALTALSKCLVMEFLYFL